MVSGCAGVHGEGLVPGIGKPLILSEQFGASYSVSSALKPLVFVSILAVPTIALPYSGVPSAPASRALFNEGAPTVFTEQPAEDGGPKMPQRRRAPRPQDLPLPEEEEDDAAVAELLKEDESCKKAEDAGWDVAAPLMLQALNLAIDSI